jgi:glutaredoxin
MLTMVEPYLMSFSVKKIAFILSIFLITLYVFFQNLPPLHSTIEAHEPKVVLYSVTNCPYCKKIRQLFKTHRIYYKEYNIETSSKAAQKFNAFDAHGIPLVIIDDITVEGFDKEKLLFLLKESGYALKEAVL